jgi:hypothetical protein
MRVQEAENRKVAAAAAVNAAVGREAPVGEARSEEEKAAEAKATAERMAEATRRARERNSAAEAKAAIEKAKSKERAVAQKRKAVAAARGDSGPGKCVQPAHDAPHALASRHLLSAVICMTDAPDLRKCAPTAVSFCLR